MAKSNTVSDAYLEDLTAQIRELDEKINAAVPKKLLDEKAEKEIALRNYKAFLKKKQSS